MAVLIRSVIDDDDTYYLQVFLEKAFYDEEKNRLFESSKKKLLDFLKQRECLRDTINATSALKECITCHYWYFFNHLSAIVAMIY